MKARHPTSTTHNIFVQLWLCYGLGACSAQAPEALGRIAAAPVDTRASDDAGRTAMGSQSSPANVRAPSVLIRDAGTGSKPVVPITQRFPPPATLPAFTRDDTAQSGLAPETLHMLATGSAPCPSGIAYPNEGTLFPGGLLPPTIMWSLPAGQAQFGAYLHLRYAGSDNPVDYALAVDGRKPGELKIPKDAWQEITARAQDQPLMVELKVGVGAEVQACAAHWQIARGNITGSLFYYQSYTNYADALGMVFTPADMQAGIFRMRLGQDHVEPFLVVKSGGTECTGCHSMNARGTRMAAMHLVGDVTTLVGTASYDVYDVTTDKPMPLGTADNSALSALTPDGKYLLTQGAPDCSGGGPIGVTIQRNPWFTEGPSAPKLLETDTGMEVASHGLTPEYYMWMPQFSPDGTKVVFNHAKADPNRPGFTDRRELAVMDYDRATQTFSNLRVIVSRLGPDPTQSYAGAAFSAPFCMTYPTPGRGGCIAPTDATGCSVSYPMGVCDGPCYPAWPTFTPDSRGVVFSLVDQPDFNHVYGRSAAAKSHLYYVDIESGQSVRLDNAMRVSNASELGYDNYPTVLPVSAGGYAWMFWTARRGWGTHADGIFGSAAGSATTNSAGNPSARKLWVSALKLAGNGASTQPMADPSFPAFYLEGQGDRPSMRAFAALNACHADGTPCGSGVDCCSGFCPSGVCGIPMTPRCSKTMDACRQSADCCQDELAQACIGGFCDVVVLQ